ncbi:MULTISPECIES: hypothetical protein [Burkholderia]|uniref:hypothetical protein n=1 Tax=Burkholderia TaxID=32008 RepID=UPI002AB0D072|nr:MULTISPECIES: hypothetical protein [Burkholderia]
MSDLCTGASSASSAPFDLAGKALEEIVQYVERMLRSTELEPEWVVAANLVARSNEALYGLKPSSVWPCDDTNRRRGRVSVERGTSEGWIVVVDSVWLAAEGGSGHWRTQPLIRIKTLTRSHGWAVAAVVSRLLEID